MVIWIFGQLRRNKHSQPALWMYVNGELIVECPVVTGCVKDGHSTPWGLFTYL